MSFKVDAREVLSYLNQLGYKNIDASQLQAFMKDLKKLMKYEERKYNEPEIIKVNILRTLDFNEKENLNPTSNVNNSGVSTSQFSTAVELNNSKINSPVRRPTTEPFQTTKAKNKPSLSIESTGHSTVACPVHFFRDIDCPETPRSKSVGTSCTCPVDAYSQVSTSCMKDKNKKRGKRPACSSSESKIETNTTTSFLNDFDDKISSRYCPTGKKKKSTASRSHTHDFTHPCHCTDSMKPRSAGKIQINLTGLEMSHKIDPREVLCILNTMGYKNIDSKLLKLFIKDMKKLRKYEERKNRNPPSSLKTESRTARRRSVKIILTKPSGSIISLTDDSIVDHNLEDSRNVSKIVDQNTHAMKPSHDQSNNSILIFK